MHWTYYRNDAYFWDEKTHVGTVMSWYEDGVAPDGTKQWIYRIPDNDSLEGMVTTSITAASKEELIQIVEKVYL